MPNNIVVGFSSNDFFHVKAQKDKIMPSDAKCSEYKRVPQKMWDVKCSVANINDKKNAKECVDKELCINKERVNTLYSVQNNHSGSEQKFLDIKKQYSDELLNAFNLGIGIMILVRIIYNRYI
jgi:hypothetical protein